MLVLQRCFQSYVRLISLGRDRARSLGPGDCARTEETSCRTHVYPARPPEAPGMDSAREFPVHYAETDIFHLDQITALPFKHLVASTLLLCLVPKLRSEIGMDDLQNFPISASKWSNQNAMLDGFVSTLQCGGLFTNRVKATIAHGTAPKCAPCDSQDGMMHRLYHCPGRFHLRHGPDWETLRCLPHATLTWGLFRGPGLLHTFWKELDTLPASTFQQLPPGHEMVHIFPDGSCSVPKSGRSKKRDDQRELSERLNQTANRCSYLTVCACKHLQ